MRITKVTTRTGDTGQTSLGSGERVKKNHPRINLLGELDHFNSVIGWTITSFSDNNIIKKLKSIQQDIFNISGDVSIPEGGSGLLKEERLIYIESQIESITSQLPPLREFILPGGSESASRLHIARTVCRKVERALVATYENDEFNDMHLKYINRLSDYLFLLARLAKHNEGLNEEHWDLNK